MYVRTGNISTPVNCAALSPQTRVGVVCVTHTVLASNVVFLRPLEDSGLDRITGYCLLVRVIEASEG